MDNCNDQSSPLQFKYMIFHLFTGVKRDNHSFVLGLSRAVRDSFLIFFLEQEILKQGFNFFFEKKKKEKPFS